MLRCWSSFQYSHWDSIFVEGYPEPTHTHPYIYIYIHIYA